MKNEGYKKLKVVMTMKRRSFVGLKDSAVTSSLSLMVNIWWEPGGLINMLLPHSWPRKVKMRYIFCLQLAMPSKPYASYILTDSAAQIFGEAQI